MYEHPICLIDESAPLPQCKIYPLDETKLAELKKQLTLWLESNRIKMSNSLHGAPVLFT